MSFDTFPIPDMGDAVDAITQRLSQQDAIASEIAAALGSALVSRLGYQDSLQNRLQGKVRKVANGFIRSQQSVIDSITSKLQTAGAPNVPGVGDQGASVAPATFFYPYSYPSPGSEPAPAPVPLAPSPAPVAPPPTGTSGGTTLPGSGGLGPPPPNTSIVLWYCILYTKTDLSGTISGTFSAPEGTDPSLAAEQWMQASGLPISSYALSGPFGTQADAAASVNCAGVTPPPPPPPPVGGNGGGGNGLPPSPAPATCGTPWPIPDVFAGGIPVPGTLEWCKTQDAIIDFFVVIGKGIRALLLAATDPANLQTLLDESAGDLSLLNPLDYPKGAAIWLTSKLVEFASPAICIVHNSIVWADQLLSASVRCKPEAYVALVALSGLLKSLKRTRFGTDAIIWATVDLSIDLPAVEVALDYIIAAACPTEIPSVAEALECWLQGTAPEEQIRCWMLMRGTDPDLFKPVLLAKADRLGAKEIIEWGRRIGATPDQIDAQLTFRGWARDSDRQGIEYLYDRLPSVGESLDWFAHNVDDLGDVLRSGKFSGFDDVQKCFDRWKLLVSESGVSQPIPDGEALALIQKWADYMHGVGQDPTFIPRFGKALRDQGVSDSTITQNYLANWQLPPVTQLYEMAFRLRPGRVPKELEFTDAQLRRYLAEWKFAPFWLDRLSAIARPVPNLTLVTQAFQVGTLSEQEYIGRLQDLGFGDTDAKMLAEARKLVSVRQLTSQAHGWTPSALASSYGAQTIDDELVDTEMKRQGWDDKSIAALKLRALTDVRSQVVVRARRRAVQTATAQVVSSYKAGTVSRDEAVPIMTGLGFTPELAGGVFDATDAAVHTAVVSKAIVALRRSYLAGELSLLQVQDQMVAIGITAERQASYIQTWQIEFTAPRKAASTQQIVKWVYEGLLDVPTAAQRLLNLGWVDPDLTLMFAEVNQRMAARQARANLAQQRSAKAAAAALAKAQKEAAAHARQLQGDLRRMMPVNRIKKWFLSGQVTQQFVIDRLMQSGYSPESIALYISEWAGTPAPGSKEYDALVEKAQAKLRGRFPIAEMRKAFKAGAIDESYIKVRLAKEGYGPQLVEVLAGEITKNVTQTQTGQTAQIPP